MDMTSHAPDNLAELLDKVVLFTTSRRNVLYRNIREAQTPGFVPHDMPVGEFAQAMNEAVAEHVTRQRLLFRDTENIAFGPNGQMQVSTVVDEHAQTLLAADHDEYLEHQISKLLENSLNRAVAEDLLKIKHETLAGSSSFHGGHGQPETDSTDGSPSPWDGCE
jgi:flagellar basal body rod protein FlgB